MVLSKLIREYRKVNAIDFFRKSIYVLQRNTTAIKLFFRRIRAWYFLKRYSVILGRNITLSGFSHMVSIGTGLNIYNNCIIEMQSTGELHIGDNCVFSYGVLISCSCRIELGNNVMIGEYTSIRDSAHNHKITGSPMKGGEDITQSIIIGSDVWIGRGCIIMPGTVVESGVVIGANSVVKGTLISRGIYAGAPAKLIKFRPETAVANSSLLEGNFKS